MIAQKAIASTATLPAPTGGWNARDAIAQMPPTDAVYLTNFVPNPTTVNLRNGYTQYATGLAGQVETLMAYAGGAQNNLFAIAGGNIYDVTNGNLGNYLSLPGGSGNYVSTPNAAPVDITGDIDIIICVAPADWSVSQTFISKSTTAGNEVSWRFQLTHTLSQPRLSLTNSPDGTAASAVTRATGIAGLTPIVSNGQAIWLRVALDVDNGSAGNTATFYYSQQSVTTAPSQLVWIPVFSGVVITAGTTSIFNGTADVEVGSSDVGTVGNFTGRIYGAYIYSGIGGTLKASMNPNDAGIWATHWASVLTGETWTVHGTAAIPGTLEVSGLSNSRWQYGNITTPGGSYLTMVNGLDNYRIFDGTTWHKDGDGSPYDITGVDSSTLIDLHIFKSRQWFVQKNTLVVWYLAVNSIGGTATALDLSSVFQQGGYIMGMGTWTLDAGYGVDDYAVWITSKGEVAVYQLTDPTSPAGIALIGIWRIGTPIGRRCFVKYRGDNLIITQDGVFPLSSALQSSRLDPRVSITDKIYYAMSVAVSTYSGNFGWQLLQFPKENLLFLNVPVQEGLNQQQYVMNTINGSWCNFTGWQANCWELFNDQPYFGGNGFVGQAWNTNADAGTNINGDALQAFTAMKKPGLQKRFTRIRPFIYSNGIPTIFAGLNIDFSTADPTGPVVFAPTTYGIWDIGLWDAAVWGGDLTINNQWQGVNGVGYWAAPHLKVSCMGIQANWVVTDIVYEQAPSATA